MPLENPAAIVDEQSLKGLEALEAEMAAENKADNTPSTDTTKVDDRASTAQEDEKATPDSKTATGIPSEADKQEIETAKAEAEKEGKELDVDDKGTPKRDAQGKFVKREKKAPEEPAVVLTAEERVKFDKYLAQREGSKYAKDFARRKVTWAEINTEKEKLATEKTAQQKNLQAALNKFNADVQAFRNEQQAAKPSPEKFEDFAQKATVAAALKEAEMVKAEANGDLDKSRELYAEVFELKKRATEAKAHAEHLRKNPPPNQKQIEEKFKSDQSTWIAKANTDYPEFARKDSPIRNAAVEVWKEITTADPQLAKLPGLIYHCAKYAAAKTAADRVPVMEKELGELRTKVKELELLTNPTPSGGVPRSQGAKSFDQMNEEEQFAQLRAEVAKR